MYLVAKLLNALFSFSLSDQYYDPIFKRVTTRWTLLLPGSGCAWAKRDKNGCFMCGFKHKTKQFTYGYKLPSPIYSLLVYLGYLLVRDKKPELAAIYVGGSFLNPEEISEAAQKSIIMLLTKIGTLRRILIESRPEYITTKSLTYLLPLMDGKKLEVGIGLECASDDIRNRCINKGFQRAHFEEAYDVLKANDVLTLVYIFVKPILLSESKAIEETISSIKYTHEMGVDEIVLEPAMIQEKTMMHTLYTKGDYKLPWLWSLIEIAKTSQMYDNVRFGSFSDSPRPLAIPRNCENCSEHIYHLFDTYKLSPDISIFNTKCDCKQEWNRILHD